MPQELGTVPRLSPTLAPSLPGAPLAPRGPWGPGGPWTPRSPGKPLSPWGGRTGPEAVREVWGDTLGCSELRGTLVRFSLPWHQQDRGLRRLQGHPEGQRGRVRGGQVTLGDTQGVSHSLDSNSHSSLSAWSILGYSKGGGRPPAAAPGVCMGTMGRGQECPQRSHSPAHQVCQPHQGGQQGRADPGEEEEEP